MSPRKKATSLFYDMVIGEYLLFVTKMSTKKLFQSETETVEETQPIAIEGYLLDMDEEWFFIGGSPDEISCFLKKNDVMEISIIKEKSPFDVILDDVDVPPDQGFN